MGLIVPAATQMPPCLSRPGKSARRTAPIPAAIQMDGKDFKGNVNLEPGLYCISGDVTINAQG